MPWVLPRPHELFLLGFETAIWHFRSATSCFYWASKLLSGTFSAPLKSFKTLKTLPAAFNGLSLLCHGTSEAPQSVSIGRRKCYLARCSFRRPFAALPWVLPRPHELFLLGFETAIWHFRGATSCFYWASKLLSGTLQLSTAIRCFAMGPPEAPQAVGFFYWASKLLSGTFSAPLKSFKTLKTLPAAFDGLRCFTMGHPEAPRAVSVGLRNCYLALPKRHKMFLFGFATGYLARCSFRRPFAALPWVLPRPHKLFLLGFETAIWHFRSATSCFYWAWKLLSGTFSAPLKTFKGFKTLPAAFDGLSLLCHWVSKLLSGNPEAPQAVSIGLQNCYLARFQHP